MEGYHYESSFLFPFPNRLSQGKYEFEGNTYLFPENDFGRPNALHGFLHDRPFELTSRADGYLSFHYDYKGGLSHYPFPCSFDIDYRLGKGSLTIEVTIKNQSDSNLPFGFGWHPYFQLGEMAQNVKLKMEPSTLVEVDELMIPNGKTSPFHTFEMLNTIVGTKLDSCFKLNKPTHRNSTYLSFPDKSMLEIWQDVHHPYVQVYTPDDQKTIAIEPMTCNINALATGDGLSLLKPGESKSLQFGLEIK